MSAQKVIINDSRTRFYCWGWDQYFPVWKLGWRCFCSGCRFMYVPELPHLRKEEMATGRRPVPLRRGT